MAKCHKIASATMSQHKTSEMKIFSSNAPVLRVVIAAQVRHILQGMAQRHTSAKSTIESYGGETAGEHQRIIVIIRAAPISALTGHITDGMAKCHKLDSPPMDEVH